MGLFAGQEASFGVRKLRGTDREEADKRLDGRNRQRAAIESVERTHRLFLTRSTGLRRSDGAAAGDVSREGGSRDLCADRGSVSDELAVGEN